MPDSAASALLTLMLVAVLDSILSVDNALVLAVVVEHLPRSQRSRALSYGIAGAYVMRGLSIFLVSFLVSFWPLKLAGALYLLWLGFSHILERNNAEADPTRPKKDPASFWLTVIQVQWLDLTFSLDNILATVALAPNNILIVIIGVAVSILALRLAAGMFLRLIGRFPVLRITAYILVIFIGAKLLLSFWYELPQIETFVLIVGIIVLSILYERAQKAMAVRAATRESTRQTTPKS